MDKIVYTFLHEDQLFAELATGSERAFEAIFNHYKPRITAFVRKMVHSEWLAEEITQDVFIKLWFNRSYLAEVAHPTSYLFNIATHKTLDNLKKISHEEALMEKIAYQTSEICNTTEEQLLFRESAQLIELAVAAMPEQRKLIYQLSRDEGLSHEQIAERLNISKSTVNNQLVHALKHIRSFLENRASLFSYAVFFFLIK